VFDIIDPPSDARVLSLGCGPADLWQTNCDRVSDDWEVVVTDLSPGMTVAACENLADCSQGFNSAVADAATIPFDTGTFDVVTANFMLYHVPDRAQALAEIQRVLTSGGRLYAATAGTHHMQELRETEATVHRGEPKRRGHQFSLENGREQLISFFETVELCRHDAALVVTDVAPLIAYSLSHDPFTDSDAPALRAAFEERFENGRFRIQKDVGLFVAQTKHGTE
jgi:SAM-dependent methyltransferase